MYIKIKDSASKDSAFFNRICLCSESKDPNLFPRKLFSFQTFCIASIKCAMISKIQLCFHELSFHRFCIASTEYVLNLEIQLYFHGICSDFKDSQLLPWKLLFFNRFCIASTESALNPKIRLCFHEICSESKDSSLLPSIPV